MIPIKEVKVAEVIKINAAEKGVIILKIKNLVWFHDSTGVIKIKNQLTIGGCCYV